MNIFKAFAKSIKNKNYWLALPFLVMATVYVDVIQLGNYTIPKYIIINFIELTLILSGINIGYWTCYFELTSNSSSAKAESFNKGYEVNQK